NRVQSGSLQVLVGRAQRLLVLLYLQGKSIVLHACWSGLAGDAIERRTAAHGSIHNLAVILCSLRGRGDRNQDLKIARLRSQGLVSKLKGLGVVTLVHIQLRKLPIAVSYGLRIGRKFLQEVLPHGQLLLLIIFSGNRLDLFILRRAGGDDDFFNLRAGGQGGQQNEKTEQMPHGAPPKRYSVRSI